MGDIAWIDAQLPSSASAYDGRTRNQKWAVYWRAGLGVWERLEPVLLESAGFGATPVLGEIAWTDVSLPSRGL